MTTKTRREDITFEECRLTIPNGMSFEEWSAVGVTLQRAEHSALFWIGDWSLYGEQHFGEDYAQGIEDYASETVRVAHWVAEHIEPARRRKELSWSHHRAVASLEPAAQDAVMAEAVTERWTVAQTRDRVVELKPESRDREVVSPEPSTLADALRAALEAHCGPKNLDRAVRDVLKVLKKEGLTE